MGSGSETLIWDCVCRALGGEEVRRGKGNFQIQGNASFLLPTQLPPGGGCGYIL